MQCFSAFLSYQDLFVSKDESASPAIAFLIQAIPPAFWQIVLRQMILSVSDRVLNQGRDLETMAVSILLRRLCLGKMNMPAAAHVDRAAGPAMELMKMSLIKISTEAHFMHMVAVSQRNRFTAYRCKPVVVRISVRFRNLHAAHKLMHMPLLAAASAHMAAICL